MNVNLRIALAAAMISWLLPLLATAQEEPQGEAWNRHVGWYTEATAGTNLYYLAVFNTGTDASNSGFTGGGWSGAVGYHLGPIFALEGGFMQSFLKLDGDDDEPDEGNEEVFTPLNVPYAALRWDVPIEDRFGLIGKLGVMVPFATDSDANQPIPVLPLVGVGASYAVSPRLQLSLQYQGAVYFIAGAGLFSLGATYHF